MIGPSARPKSANPHCCAPCRMPRRSGLAADATAVKLVGVYAPSAAPIRARMKISPTMPEAMPENPDISENTNIAGISILR